MAKPKRIMLAITAWYDYKIWQMDVKTVFLDGFVEEEIYMDQPEGFTVIGEEQKDLGEAFYILGIKIFGDISKRIVGMTQNSNVEKVLKRFKMEHSEREFLLMRHGVKLFKKQSPKTDEKLKRMLDVPCASAVGNIHGELILEGYSDASFQSDDDDAISRSGFVFKLNGGMVAWKSSK
ncbi:UNVERIFIED_CONTAM: hypothetical protein Sradi_4920300 [Sesamum radiatum]|uniref:Reverse transcriptase Ty1/copia-type domain-containing protein n=1 Tax=Sesamum radiatum TaxID=300843 RepID=A0AAW2MGT4_SESRA